MGLLVQPPPPPMPPRAPCAYCGSREREARNRLRCNSCGAEIQPAREGSLRYEKKDVDASAAFTLEKFARLAHIKSR
jgi:hypothetical protein